MLALLKSLHASCCTPKTLDEKCRHTLPGSGSKTRGVGVFDPQVDISFLDLKMFDMPTPNLQETNIPTFWMNQTNSHPNHNKCLFLSMFYPSFFPSDLPNLNNFPKSTHHRLSEWSGPLEPRGASGDRDQRRLLPQRPTAAAGRGVRQQLPKALGAEGGWSWWRQGCDISGLMIVSKKTGKFQEELFWVMYVGIGTEHILGCVKSLDIDQLVRNLWS